VVDDADIRLICASSDDDIHEQNNCSSLTRERLSAASACRAALQPATRNCESPQSALRIHKRQGDFVALHRNVQWEFQSLVTTGLKQRGIANGVAININHTYARRRFNSEQRAVGIKRWLSHGLTDETASLVACSAVRVPCSLIVSPSSKSAWFNTKSRIPNRRIRPIVDLRFKFLDRPRQPVVSQQGRLNLPVNLGSLFPLSFPSISRENGKAQDQGPSCQDVANPA
jgi:hypothetical protein